MRKILPWTHVYTPLSPARRSKKEAMEEEPEYEVEEILDHRPGPEGILEYYLQWAPHSNGTEYEPSWQPKKNVNPALRRSYHGTGAALPPIPVTLDARPVVGLALERIWNTITLAKTQARPRIHEIELPEISLPELGDVFLDTLADPWKLHGLPAAGAPLKWRTHPDQDDGVVTKELIITRLDAISALCSFERRAAGARGLLRYDIGRASDHSMLGVGFPFMVQVSNNRRNGLVTTTMTFPTVIFNGATGHPQPPAMKKGMLKEQENITQLVKFVRNLTPSTHPLAVHGWTALPDEVHELPNPINFPAPAPSPS